MALPLQKPLHLFDYLAFDNGSQERHEYVGGRIHAMEWRGPEPVALRTMYAGTDIAA